jgi:transcriptional regulator with XRE-family HTH domain
MNPILILSELKAIGLTQSQIAGEIGCSQPTISDMAAGKVGMTRPSFKVINGLQQLAEKHGIKKVSPT